MTGERRALSGVLLLDKPAGMSSTSAVGTARRLFNASSAGHTGTLDPFATGLLPVCFGEATKFSQFMLEADKGYRATLKLGETTDTGDREGKVLLSRPIALNRARIESALQKFLGPQQQVPPMHSALKRNGVPLYRLARQGIVVERPPRQILVRLIRFVDWSGDQLKLEVLVSKGTYIRVLAADIGEELGCGAHLIDLQRTACGGFSIEEATTFDQIGQESAQSIDRLLLPPDRLAMSLGRLDVAEDTARKLQAGQRPDAVPGTPTETRFRAYGPAGHFLGIVECRADADPAPRLVAVRMMSGRIIGNG